jgi:hypothetical protein
MRRSLAFLAFTLVARGQTTAPAVREPAEDPAVLTIPAGTEPPSDRKVQQRTALNLAGTTDTGSGESRRNENVYFNPIDNNALKELNVRLGTTATIVDVFRVERNYFGAEFGNSPGTPIHVSRGENQSLHGRIDWLHNNSVFKARSFFQVGGVKPAHENDYGFAVGARVWRRAFLSAEGNQQKVRGSVNGNILVPMAHERTPLTSDPRLRPIVERFLAAYPAALPNRTDINPRALNTNAPQRIDTQSGGLRLDQGWGARDVIKLRYQYTAQEVEAFQLVAGQNPNSRTLAHLARVTWTRVWNPTRTTDLSAGFDRVSSLLLPEPNAVGPAVSFGDVIEKLGPGSDFPVDRAQNLFRYAGQTQIIQGRHTWTAGFDVTRRHINGLESSSHTGVLSFRNDFGRDAMTNFLLGIPGRFSGAIGNVHRGFRNWEPHLYLGNVWRVNSNLTLNAGVRFQPVTGPMEVNGLTTIPYGCDCNNIAPRIGFAYRLPGQWGVLRGAYGLHYGEIFPVTFQQLRFNPPLNRKFEIQAPDLASVFGLADARQAPVDTRATVYDLSPDLATPYSQQYNWSWEPALRSSWKLQFAYVGSRSDKLLVMWYVNRAQVVPGIDQTTATINLRRPDPRYFDNRYVLNGSRGYFDAARATVIVPSWRGLSLEASYWLSKAIDLGGNYTNTAASEDGRQGRSQVESLFHEDLKGLSSFDQPHAFLMRASWAAPVLRGAGKVLGPAFGRWTLSTVYLGKSGTPFSVFSGSDGPGYGNVDGASGDRPHVIDPSVLGRTIGHPDVSAALLPRSAFRFMAPTEQRGNLGIHTFRKGGIRNINAALSRAWETAGAATVTFRAESINLFNTPQFADPGKDLTSPNFGQITNTLNDGRMFQFSLQLRF